MAATSNTTTATTTTVSLKLLVNKTTNKVIFAEANKDFVDFLFHILSLPVGTIIRLLTAKGVIGSIGNLYESLQNLNLQYVQPSFNKDYLLKPPIRPTRLPAPLLLSISELYSDSVRNEKNTEKKFYRCSSSSCRHYISDNNKVRCPGCLRCDMNTEMQYVAAPSNGSGEQEAKKKMESSESMEEGYVKGVVSYMVMDDLVVQPMSTISSIALFSKFSINDISVLEEKLMSFGLDEGLSLLKASLQSKTVLTDVFLGNRARAEEAT